MIIESKHELTVPLRLIVAASGPVFPDHYIKPSLQYVS